MHDPVRTALWRVAALSVVALAAAPPVSAQTVTSLHAAAGYSADHAGDAVLVFQRDSLVLEEYQNGFAGQSPHPLASGTKTFSCVLAALAVGDGLLGLDEPVARTLSGFQAESLTRLVTIRQLLNLTSGLEPDATGTSLVVASPPGERFAYGGTSFAVFGEVMSHKLHDNDLVAFLTRRIFAPLGVTVAGWERDGEGRPNLASGAELTARDWGRFGLLLLDRGRWRGRQLLPREALAECGHGSTANPGYGLGVWLNAPAPAGGGPRPQDRVIYAPDLPHDLWLAAGSGGQRLYIIPTAGLVVVRFGHNTGPDYRDEIFLKTLLGR